MSRIRNRVGFRERVAGLQGRPVDYDLSRFEAPLGAINSLEPSLARLDDAQLQDRGRALRGRVDHGTRLHEVRDECFALAREAARRTVGLRPFDVQVLAALALHEGSIVEMQTGEGKTLAAVLPASLNALTGLGVHVLTFNDYLARRDAEWMGPIYRLLGLSVGFVQERMPARERREAYAADVTYVTAKEAGFDHLRDLLAKDVSALVHRPFNFVLVDEADSLLIDEARSPLVIAGHGRRETSCGRQLAGVIAGLTPGLHFDLDEYARDVELTEAGIDVVERALRRGRLHDEGNYRLLTEVNCALHARALLRKNVDYIVRGGRVQIVDEFTGRVVHDRHWPDGLQAAVEAKEGLEREPDGEILGTVAIQHFLNAYPRLCGMTGTARDAAWEMHELYGARTVVVPTNRPCIRTDHPDVVFAHREAKERAVVEEVRASHATGRPVLVGTLTVEESERMADRLRAAGVPCEVLNARNDEAEAAIVERAGAPGAVTISTNMAGRGTDIRLGGPNEAERDRVVALGGLYIVGTNRHESRRVDLQLRGRAGRQGDPGETRFFVSLEDDLMLRYRLHDLLPANVVPPERDGPIEHPIVRREMARAQRIIEGQNLEIRRTLWRYSSLVEVQRQRLMALRQAILVDCRQAAALTASSERRAALAAAAGEEAVCRAEQAVALFQLDRAWREHLALVADIREGIHLVALGGGDPLTRFTSEVVQAFERLKGDVARAVLDTMDHAVARDGTIELPGVNLQGPSSTWTYIVTDDPFRNQIGRLLTGPGRTTIAIYAAAVMMPLLILWGLVDRLLRRRPPRGATAVPAGPRDDRTGNGLGESTTADGAD